MIHWKEESIRFMVDSLEYTAFAAEQCKHLLPHLKPTDTVLEAGSGIGYLTRAMAEHVEKVISVEFDPTASAYLKKSVAEEALTNIRAENADALAFDPKEKVDVLVCCRFGSMEEILTVAKNTGAKKVLVLTLANKRHRVSAEGKGEEVKEYCRPNLLTENGISYTEEFFTLQNGQPLHSLTDAVAFFRMYDRKGAEITEETARAALIPDPKGEYEWYYPMESRFRLIAFEMK
ncbi:MAG: methyltransferase domain-containing protein [Oscillospiraceae bacterium]|nr:methyltransferase domain-containing protein [Oscillospiraceae bacterium]